MSPFWRALVLVAWLVMPRWAQAACPTHAGSSSALTRASPAARAAYLRSVLEEQRSRVAWWNWGFTALGYGLAAGQLTLGLSTDLDGDRGEPNQRAFYLVNATRGTLGATWALLQPLQIDVSALDTALPSGSNEQATCEWLARAEANLEASAALQQRHRSPLKHAVVVAAALASGLVLGLGFDEWGRGGLSAGMGLVLGESQIWLQPMGAISALERYEHGALASASAGRTLLALQPATQGTGLALSVRF